MRDAIREAIREVITGGPHLLLLLGVEPETALAHAVRKLAELFERDRAAFAVQLDELVWNERGEALTKLAWLCLLIHIGLDLMREAMREALRDEGRNQAQPNVMREAIREACWEAFTPGRALRRACGT